jgi:hypothetical protein
VAKGDAEFRTNVQYWVDIFLQVAEYRHSDGQPVVHIF